ncbi:hypothetical protein PG985_002277 [Apiospora marii]|uniref:Stc1 domain-containing protein n=1 Tax=Apiospora marii TaxID=335849 RepID=A0ABR1RZ43_9PEZI
MLKSKRRKGAVEASSRFCVDCGIEKHTQVGGNGNTMSVVSRYLPGNFVTIGGVRHVVCIECREFGLAAQAMQYPPTFTLIGNVCRGNGYLGPLRKPILGDYTQYCKKCWDPIQKRLTDEQMEREKQSRREEKAAERAARVAAYGRSPLEPSSPVSGDDDDRDYTMYCSDESFLYNSDRY